MNSDAKPMSAREFKKFRREVLQLGEREASQRLGMSRGFLRTCEAEGAPLYVAYACAAIAKKLLPLGVSGPVHWNDETMSFQDEPGKN